MFRNKTLFILGAGASFEAGMPIGATLASDISRLLYMEWNELGQFEAGDREFAKFLQRHGFGWTDMAAMAEIAKGIRFSNSIDEYLDRFKDPETIKLGKLAIAYTIMNYESGSKVATRGPDIDAEVLNNTWYMEFAKMLFRSTALQDLDKLFSNLSIIDFNYDRCLQKCLRHAIKDAYRVDFARADALIETMAYFRPYGSIGALTTVANPNGLHFGDHPISASTDQILKSLKTFTEQVDSEAAYKIKEAYADAKTIVFLGFGFHSPNMALLASDTDYQRNTTKILATAKGISDDDQAIIKRIIGTITTNAKAQLEIIVKPITCVDLFREYRLTLQAA